ncbi:hsp70-Hsp90 organizing protein 3-like [Chanos chanos]|uniref:Hsp70-Hsp90 organizing protein 3-like n=1 Tax=Chanos chanos TaxID=29144 RepID=A0A6J2W5U8_CHACN|nr:hsp70-Hsp90 organizing protein 3-like [Chanos chanos]
MVELMKFTRDICRFLGIGREEPIVQEKLECENGASADQKSRYKRQRERKKQENEEKNDFPLQDWEDEEEEGEEEEDDVEEASTECDRGIRVEKVQDTEVCHHGNKPEPLLTTSVERSNGQLPDNQPEEDPEWDVSSAFVVNAVSHIRPRGRTKSCQSSRDKDNETRVNGTDMRKKRGAALTEKGIKLFKQGLYSQAVSMFTEAIQCDPKDHRFFGNRSYCYWCLEQYTAALSDAQKSIQLAPDWPKGYFRKGSALMGLKRYMEAEKAMQQVLKLDKDCEEATHELHNCRVLQLMEMGFGEVQSVLLLEKFTTVQAVLSSPGAAKGSDTLCFLLRAPCPSLWVGNVTLGISERRLWDLFETCGKIDSIRVLHERLCAFINFRNAGMAARALEKLQGVELENTRLVIRYPDRWMQKSLPSQKTVSSSSQQSVAAGCRHRGPVNGDECFFWRTTGCFFGDKCRYRHVPDQRGRDRKPWQP